MTYIAITYNIIEKISQWIKNTFITKLLFWYSMGKWTIIIRYLSKIKYVIFKDYGIFF